jgi:hypothetical protein
MVPTGSRLVSLALASIVVVCLLSSPTDALRLRFDPDFSPPSHAEAIANPMRYRAYNRPMLSHTRRPVKVRVEDDNGNLVVTGPDSQLLLRVASTVPSAFARVLPDEQPMVNMLQSRGVFELYTRTPGAQHPFTPSSHGSLSQESTEASAYRLLPLRTLP